MAEIYDTRVRSILTIFFVILVFYLLKLLSALLIPLVLALLFALLFQPLILFLNKRKVPNWIIVPIISIFSLLVLVVLVNIIIQTSADISSQQDYLLERLNLKIESILNWASSFTGTEIKPEYVTDEISKLINGEFITSVIGGVASSLSSITGSFVMFALYYIVLLSGMSGSGEYLNYLAGKNNDGSLEESFSKVSKSVYSYMVIKTLVNLSMGILVAVTCYAFGIKFPIFWGFLTFVFHYIPTIGSIIATIPPVLMGIIQFDSPGTILIFVLILMIVQFTMGNVVEPKIMGGHLRLNTVAVIFGLVFWGYIWGVTGMMLSVPLLVILKLVFEHFPSLQIFARLMGYPDKQTVG
jgi:AI-2 transport protein TqsA